MPLLDHFHPPVSHQRHWSEIHGQWPGEIVRSLFPILPPGFQAGPKIDLGSSFEVDISVARENRGNDRPEFVSNSDDGGPATMTAVGAPVTVSTDRMKFDDYEVRIYDSKFQRTLVAAIEIVSPSNKDRPETRTQFTSKCLAMIQVGGGCHVGRVTPRKIIQRVM